MDGIIHRIEYGRTDSAIDRVNRISDVDELLSIREHLRASIQLSRDSEELERVLRAVHRRLDELGEGERHVRG
jgi:hypothetical protein